jgi:hypothetical protein
MVWYYAAAPPVAAPLPALVVAQAATAGSGVGSPPPTFDVAFYDPAANTGAGGWTKVLALPFYYGTRPTSGAWITMPRVNTPAAGLWPSTSDDLSAFVFHDVPEERRNEILAEMKAAAEKWDAESKEAPKQLEHAGADEDDEEPTVTRTTTRHTTRTTHR